MNPLLIFILSLSTLITAESIQQPDFKDPIHLFDHRNLAQELQKNYPEEQFDPAVLAYLTTRKAHEQLSQAGGRLLPDIGHDGVRRTVYSGEIQKPRFLVLTFSGEDTLEKTVAALQKQRLAHNFIINRNGDIHPVTQKDEDVTTALTHRPFAVGISGYVCDGFLQERDMNSASISISVVGKDTETTTEQQEQALITLLSYLSTTYQITPERVLDYGCTAYPYGRRKVQANLPWQKLAQHNVALWPQKLKTLAMKPDYLETNTRKATHWTSLALHKIGFICPPTHNDQHPDYVKALRAFQEHYQCDNQDGIITENTLFALLSILSQHEQYNPKLKDILPPAYQ